MTNLRSITPEYAQEIVEEQFGQEQEKTQLDPRNLAPKQPMVAITPELVQKIGNYLSERPWREVNTILSELDKSMLVEI